MLLIAVLLGLVAGDAPHPDAGWTQLAPGFELRLLEAKQPSPVGDSRIAVVRVDPKSWELALVGQSGTGVAKGRTAREWAQGRDLVLAINAGMFREDYTTHVGYMETRGHVNSSGINPYQSVAAFDPHDRENRPAFRIFDLDAPGVTVQTIRQDYASLVQNLRLIKRPGVNRWSPQEKSWSEAALGEDADGRILFVLTRSAFSMHDLVEELLSAGIGIVAAQHLEGGRLAQLYLKVGDFELELFESYESGFGVDAAKPTAWPIPNVLGVRRKPEVE
jgi:uncharacterized protein YigE (DUF2233 family)